MHHDCTDSEDNSELDTRSQVEQMCTVDLSESLCRPSFAFAARSWHRRAQSAAQRQTVLNSFASTATRTASAHTQAAARWRAQFASVLKCTGAASASTHSAGRAAPPCTLWMDRAYVACRAPTVVSATRMLAERLRVFCFTAHREKRVTTVYRGKDT